MFVKDAIDTKSQLEDDKKTVHDFLQKLKGVSNFIEQNGFIQIQADEIQSLLKQLQNAKNDIERAQGVCDRYSKDKDIEQHKIDRIQKDIITYNENVTILENNKKIHTQIKEIDVKISHKKIELSKLNNVV